MSAQRTATRVRPEYICCQCGGPRSSTSGKRCRSCYASNVAMRRSGTDEGVVLNELLRGEQRGMFVQTPDGWTLPEFITEADAWASEYQKWHGAWCRNFDSWAKIGVSACSVEHGSARVDVNC